MNLHESLGMGSVVQRQMAGSWWDLLVVRQFHEAVLKRSHLWENQLEEDEECESCVEEMTEGNEDVEITSIGKIS